MGQKRTLFGFVQICPSQLSCLENFEVPMRRKLCLSVFDGLLEMKSIV